MAKFKVGDRVHVTEMQRSWDTEIADVREDKFRLKEWLFGSFLVPGVEFWEASDFVDIELIEEKTMENLKAGDVLEKDNQDFDRIVMLVVGDYVLTADTDDGTIRGKTTENLKNNDWKLKGAEPELREVSMNEVAQAMGIPVETLRIKKDN